MARVPKFLDVSVSLASGIPAYPGNPEFDLQPIKRIAEGGSSNVSKLVMGSVAEKVMLTTKRPVLLVKPERLHVSHIDEADVFLSAH